MLRHYFVLVFDFELVFEFVLVFEFEFEFEFELVLVFEFELVFEFLFEFVLVRPWCVGVGASPFVRVRVFIAAIEPPGAVAFQFQHFLMMLNEAFPVSD